VPSSDIVYRNAKVFTADASTPRASAVAVSGNRIAAVGAGDADALIGPRTTVVDVAGRLVVPGITDAHFHTLMTGASLLRADLVHAKDLEDVARILRAWAAANPGSAWVLGRGWLHSAIPAGAPTREMLDAIEPERPAFLDANDLHSAWVNTRGLELLGITRETPDPAGGEIVRDAEGEPTGELKETAVVQTWAYFGSLTTDQQRDGQLRSALDAAAAAGITSVVDMALMPADLEAMARAEREDSLTARIRAHVILHEDRDLLEQVAAAAEMASAFATPWLRVVGVKIISDGVIDACTAAMLRPYANGALPPPIWPPSSLGQAVTAADAAGLQIAIHAIGDAAVRNALDAFEEAARSNGTSGRRHRIEHIEYLDPSDVARFGSLGVTASMQPVHADPAIRPNWTAMLGDDRADRGFAWPELAGSTTLAFGTDAPTAPLQALPNLHVAVTRRSSLEPGAWEAEQPEFALPLEAALHHMTLDAAWASFDEDERGSLAPGKLADLVVLDRDPFVEDPGALLQTEVLRTVVDGRVVYDAGILGG
jgi:predicted amidohydrolase YtcJ